MSITTLFMLFVVFGITMFIAKKVASFFASCVLPLEEFREYFGEMTPAEKGNFIIRWVIVQGLLSGFFYCVLSYIATWAMASYVFAGGIPKYLWIAKYGILAVIVFRGLQPMETGSFLNYYGGAKYTLFIAAFVVVGGYFLANFLLKYVGFVV